MSPQIPIDRRRVAQYCQANHIRRLALFGSVLRSDFTPESDVDVLVEFEPDKIPGFAFFQMESELSDLFQRRVDLNTLGFLIKYFRHDVAEEALAIYDTS